MFESSESNDRKILEASLLEIPRTSISFQTPEEISLVVFKSTGMVMGW